MKKLAKQLLTILFLMLTASGAVFADDPDGYCDIVFYCQTTKILDVSPDGTVHSLPNEAFRFAIKEDKLLVPEGASVLGDGTQNWDAIAFCREESPKELTLDYFEAELFNGKRSLSFSDGVIQFSDTTYKSRTRVLFATCDKFD